MKTFRKYILSSVVMLSLAIMHTACSNEVPNPTPGQGNFSLLLTAADIQTEVQTRASIQGVDVNSFYVSLAEAEGTTLMVGRQYGTISFADCVLPTATGYRLWVESCTEAEATTLNNGFGAYRFFGDAVFDVQTDKSTPVTVNCTMVNAGLQVVLDKSFTDKFPVHAVTTQDSRSLVFSSNNPDAIAYYNMQTDVLPMSLRITGSSGGWDDRLDVTRQVELQKGKIIKMHITYSDASGARITVLR
jgi:hypothetical protein